MSARDMFFFAVVYLLATGTQAVERVAIARLLSATIDGTVTFTEVDGGIRVDGVITGMPAGEYGFHIHELGDVSTCDATGAHFDVDGNTHGGRDHEVRHVGDFGNVIFVGDESAVASFSFVDSVISFRGRTNIVGRAVVLHAQTDDLGLGGHETSLTTGNAGARVVCAVIGIKSPADGDAWANNSAVSTTLSTLLLSVTSLAYFTKY